MTAWARRLILPTALGLELRRQREQGLREEELSFELFLGARKSEWVQALEPLVEQALEKALAAYKRVASLHSGSWFSRLPIMRDPLLKAAAAEIEAWLGEIEAEQAKALVSELEQLERGLPEAGLAGDVGAELAAGASICAGGETSAAAVAELDAAADAALAGWVGGVLSEQAQMVTVGARGILLRATLATLGRLAASHASLRDFDVRCDRSWYGLCERLLGQLQQQQEALETALQPDGPLQAGPEALSQVAKLHAPLTAAVGLVGALGALSELERDEHNASLALRAAELGRRTGMLIELATPEPEPEPDAEPEEEPRQRPHTVRMVKESEQSPSNRQPRVESSSLARGPIEPAAAGRYGYWLSLGYEGCLLMSEKLVFSMAASLALSTLFVMLAGLGFLKILLSSISAGAHFEQLLFSTVLPQSLQSMLPWTDALVGKLDNSPATLYTLLSLLFLYFALSLMLSLASNLNHVFGISRTYSILDLNYMFGVFWKGCLLRLAAVSMILGLGMGGYAWLIEQQPWTEHILVGRLLSVIAAAMLVVVSLPLDDVPLRQRMAFAAVMSPLLPLYNLAFDGMFYNFSSYELFMRKAPVALLTLWLYFGWIILLIGLCLLCAWRNRLHGRRLPTRAAVCFEVMRLARHEPTFDELQRRTGATRAVLREVVDQLVAGQVLQQFHTDIKATSYTGDYKYRLRSFSVSRVREALMPAIGDALGSDVPVEVRRRLAEMLPDLDEAIALHLDLSDADATAPPSQPR